MKEYRTKAYDSYERCPTCNNLLLFLDPAIEGWDHYCPECEALTATHHQLQEALARIEPGGIGVISSVKFKLKPLEEDEYAE